MKDQNKMSNQQNDGSGNQPIGVFYHDNNQYYMSLDGRNFKVLGNVQGDSNGPYPPSDFLIQQVFPGYTLNFPLKTPALADLLERFQQSKRGDYINAYLTQNGPTMEKGYFYVYQNEYYMSLDNVNFTKIGDVTSKNSPIAPPTSDQIQSVKEFSTYWWAEGKVESTNEIRLFSDNSGPDFTGNKQVFILHVFSGPQ